MSSNKKYDSKIEEIYKKNINSIYNRIIKRFLDLMISFALIVLLSPIFLIISFLQVIFSGFPIFYTPQRGGYNNTNFRIIKFRTMIKDADKNGSGTTALNDKRITKFGLLLRKTKSDEIPQLFNVLFGQMSIIGPRPELIRYTKNYNEIEKYILYVRPGITDYSSINYINLQEIIGDQNADEVYEKKVLKQKNILRLKYIEKLNLINDCKIFLITFYKVIIKALKLFTGDTNGKNKNKK